MAAAAKVAIFEGAKAGNFSSPIVTKRKEHSVCVHRLKADHFYHSKSMDSSKRNIYLATGAAAFLAAGAVGYYVLILNKDKKSGGKVGTSNFINVWTKMITTKNGRWALSYRVPNLNKMHTYNWTLLQTQRRFKGKN